METTNTDLRAAEILHLYDAMANALETVVTEDTSANDVVSACLTLTLTMMLAVAEMGGSLEAFRDPLAQMYRALPTPVAN